MNFRKAAFLSIVFHSLLLLGLSIFVPSFNKKKPVSYLSAKLYYTASTRPAELLPKRAQSIKKSKIQEKKPAAKKETIKKKNTKNLQKPVQASSSSKAKKIESSEKKDKEEKVDNLAALKNLSEEFLADLGMGEDDVEALTESGQNYFDQIYTLIKQSFIVPPHLSGPAGQKLKAQIQIFLSENGRLSNIKLTHPSGDAHFDKAVVDGTKRINDFGRPPRELVSSLSMDGIVIDLCPISCEAE